jgi:hypothetical protein
MDRAGTAETSDGATSVQNEMEAARVLDDTSFRHIESTMHYIEEARARAERAANELRQMGAEPHLLEATEQAQDELTDLVRRYRHGTYFAVPQSQTSF